VKDAAFDYLTNLQKAHSKVKHINYEKLMTQTYLTSPLFSDSETKLLFALRTRTLEEIKANFGIMNGGNLNCPLDCWSQGELPLKDTQQHLLKCAKLTSELETEDISRGNVEYEHLFSDVYKQKEAAVLFERLLKAREDIKNADPPGVNLDPSTSLSSCCDDAVFTSPVLTVLSFGK
jgi:hypothetical protein